MSDYPTITDVSSPRGAPMGRGRYANSADSVARPVTLFRLPLDGGGYDPEGAYWGAPSNLWCATDEQDFRTFTRANTFNQAAAQIIGLYPFLKGEDFAPGSLDVRFEVFFDSYVKVALWSSADTPDSSTDREVALDEYDGGLHPDSLEALRRDARKFFDAYNDMWTVDHDPLAGGDLWFSRNGHGANFADHPYAYDGRAVADALNEAAREFKAIDLCIGDDGCIHASL